MNVTFLDTETTGLEVQRGDRIIEIGAIKVVDGVEVDRFYERIDPQRQINEGAFCVHGISNAMLEGMPLFSEIAPRLISFISGTELQIHNSPFDDEFLSMELKRAGYDRLEAYAPIQCTLKLAKEIHPRGGHSLDSLCDRYGIDRSHRTHHGAMLDADLLMRVYDHLIKDKNKKTEGHY